MRQVNTVSFEANSVKGLAEKIDDWYHDFINWCESEELYYSITPNILNPIVVNDQALFTAVYTVEITDEAEDEEDF